MRPCRQLVRCLHLVRDVKGRAMTVPYMEELAARYGVTTRTIRRDLIALQAAQIAVRYGTGSAIDSVTREP